MAIQLAKSGLVGLLMIALLSACAHPIVMVGPKTEAIDAAEVAVYLARRPQCEYQTVGYLKINGGYYSQAALLNKMQKQAAEVGADGVLVHETRQLDILEFIGTASAIRCVES